MSITGLQISLRSHQINVRQVFSRENERWSLDALYRYDDIAIGRCVKTVISARVSRHAFHMDVHAACTLQKLGHLRDVNTCEVGFFKVK